MAITRLGLHIDNLIAKCMVDGKENNVEDSTSMEENLDGGSHVRAMNLQTVEVLIVSIHSLPRLKNESVEVVLQS